MASDLPQTAASRRRLAWLLWLLFAATLMATAWMLLRSCGLALPFLAVDFCPLPSSLSAAEARRADALNRLAKQLEVQRVEQEMACTVPKAAAPFGLPVSPEPLHPQQVATAKPPPPLPASRWDRKDLSLLKGCWQLGHDTQGSVLGATGTEICTVRAGTICFGQDGRGERQQEFICRRNPSHSCKAPITATFDQGGRLHTTQPQVPCSAPGYVWNGPENSLVCTRVDDTHATCHDSLGFAFDFRPKARP